MIMRTDDPFPTPPDPTFLSGLISNASALAELKKASLRRLWVVEPNLSLEGE